MERKMSKQAKQLLGDYEPEMLWGDMGIRKGEYDGITHKRLLEFIRVYPVYDVSIDHNSYGEFQFISLKVKQYTYTGKPFYTLLQFWGNGFHEYRDVLIVKWNVNVNSWYVKNEFPMNKKDVIRLINERRTTMGIKQNAKQETSGNTFEMIADLSDDDYALMEGF